MERKRIGRKSPSRSRVGAKSKRRTHRRRRGIHGANDISGMLQKAGGLVVGAVAARELNTLAVKFFPTLSPMVSGLLQMGAGYFLPKVVKGAFFANVGDGMIANGGMVVVVSTGVITGSPDTMTYQISGTSNLKVVNGGSPYINVLNGPTTRVSNNPTNAPRTAVRNFALRG